MDFRIFPRPKSAMTQKMVLERSSPRMSYEYTIRHGSGHF
jgi:hypothetical protein